MYVWIIGVRTLYTEEGVSYIVPARPLRPSVMRGLKYIKSEALLVTSHIKCLNYHKVYLITDRCSAECLLTFWWSSESLWSSPSSQSSVSLVGRLEGDLF